MKASVCGTYVARNRCGLAEQTTILSGKHALNWGDTKERATGIEPA